MTELIGRRIAALRRAQGLSQNELAQKMKRSESWISQVERGKQNIDRFSMLERFAEVLNVRVDEIMGSDEADADTHKLSTGMTDLRLAITGHPAPDSLSLTSQSASIPDMEALETEVEQAWELAHSSQLSALNELLSDLIPTLETASRAKTENTEAIKLLLTRAYQAAAAAFSSQNEPDAAWIAADRAVMVAEQSGKTAEIAAALFRMARAFLSLKQLFQAKRSAQSGIEILASTSERETHPNPEILSLRGALSLVLAIIAARQQDRKTAHYHIQNAHEIAAQLGTNRNDYNTEFGPLNVNIQAIAVATELGDAGEALDIAKNLDVTNLSHERQSRFHLDRARALTQVRDTHHAINALLQAETLSPELIYSHRHTKDIVRDLTQLTAPRPPDKLRDLAQRIAASRN